MALRCKVGIVSLNAMEGRRPEQPPDRRDTVPCPSSIIPPCIRWTISSASPAASAAQLTASALTVAQILLRSKYHTPALGLLLPSSVGIGPATAGGGVSKDDAHKFAGDFTVSAPKIAASIRRTSWRDRRRGGDAAAGLAAYRSVSAALLRRNAGRANSARHCDLGQRHGQGCRPRVAGEPEDQYIRIPARS